MSAAAWWEHALYQTFCEAGQDCGVRCGYRLCASKQVRILPVLTSLLQEGKMATKKYECGRCAELHDWEDDALECCQPEPKEVYICDECEEAHESVREAEH